MASSTVQVPPTQQAGKLIRLDILLCTSQRNAWVFHPHDSVSKIKHTVCSSWPAEWPQPSPSPSLLRLLHLGRFWDDDQAQLVSHKLPLGRTTVVHMIIRPVYASGTASSSSNGKAGASASGPGLRTAPGGSGLWARLNGKEASTSHAQDSTASPVSGSSSPSTVPLSPPTSPAQGSKRKDSASDRLAEANASHESTQEKQAPRLCGSETFSSMITDHPADAVLQADPAAATTAPAPAQIGSRGEDSKEGAQLGSSGPRAARDGREDEVVGGGCCGGCVIC
ncbi:unnamed protein product [Tilletia controversa]|uniref:UBL3-like ubiquitin domain-containing protein n=1 Tax=Tilletia controversa TaxID=13291 RepID=A0A8X7MS81_9BASI|nr:hypothetical protein CF328_g4361 [Tilletia controversa]KAE8246116.1 hypothetical protein A4X06_0g5173 [Tilletia controversa]CAD6901979.1 unnamed protein product [Tilletia controversa]CAD6967754.1 unnamed protein product [Tilletia controversa]CAD6979034.1 unnamed protein product [Tilletia controversa]